MSEYKYAKVKNEETKVCDVGIGTNDAFYESLGFTKQEVEQSYTGEWYLKGYAPEKPRAVIIEEELNKQQNILSSTDWYAIRYADSGVEIPADIKEKRQAAREKIDELRLEIHLRGDIDL